MEFSKAKKVSGYKFRRQLSVGKYILDFYCPTLKLAIELDGKQHSELVNIALDAERDKFLNHHGITVLRYENRWVFEYPEVIIEEIIEFGEKQKKNNYLPSFFGESTPPARRRNILFSN